MSSESQLTLADGCAVLALLHDVTAELCMPALEIVYKADVSGKGRVWLTLRRQLRALNRLTAHWYRRWQAHSLLEKLYGDIVYELDPEGMTIH